MTGIRRDCQCPRANHQHGTNGAYERDDCRCFACRVAHSNATRAYRAGDTWREVEWAPSCGVSRRLQALAAIGWSAPMLAPRVGLSADYVSKLRQNSHHPGVSPDTHARVAALYEQLWDRPVTTANGRRCSTQAKQAGWVPPMAWDDDEIDDPAAEPHNPNTSGWDLRPCGTLAAHRRHLRRGEKPCMACVAANRRHEDEAAA